MRNITMLVLIAFVLLLALPALAQEAEPVETPVVIATEAPPVVEQPTVVDTPSAMNLLAYLLIAIAGGGSFAVVFARLSNNKMALDNAEKLYEGLSPTWQATLTRVISIAEQVTETANQALEFAKKATDGQPNDQLRE